MQCGLCHLGCHYETKQDMRVTYLHRALNNQESKIRIYCNCSAEKFEHADGTVKRVLGEFTNRDGKLVGRMTVKAKVVVVAAGAIASSHLLLRNRVAHKRVGKGLALHPVAFVL